jgi:hypothetical protein
VFIVLHFTSGLTLTAGGYFTKVLVVSQEDSQPAKAHKHEEGWPKFKYAMLEIRCCAFFSDAVSQDTLLCALEKGSTKGAARQDGHRAREVFRVRWAEAGVDPRQRRGRRRLQVCCRAVQ